MVRLTIDGSPLEVAKGALLIDALSATDKVAPHVCHDKRLVPSGTCRLHLVEVEGQRRQVTSCAVEVAKGMVVQTYSRAFDTLCRTNPGLIATHYPRTAYAADPKRPFHHLLAGYGVPPGGKHEDGFFKDDNHPCLGVSIERCIRCGRCARIHEEIQGQFIWETIGRDDATRVTIGKGPTLLTAGCVNCGTCVGSCTSGALFDKQSGAKPTA